MAKVTIHFTFQNGQTIKTFMLFSSTNGIRLPQHILLKYLCFKTQIDFVFAQFVQQLGLDRHLDQSVTNNMDCHLPFKRQ